MVHMTVFMYKKSMIPCIKKTFTMKHGTFVTYLHGADLLI